MKINLITIKEQKMGKADFANNVFLYILNDLDLCVHLDFGIKIHTMSGGCFLWYRLLEGCCRVGV